MHQKPKKSAREGTSVSGKAGGLAHFPKYLSYVNAPKKEKAYGGVSYRALLGKVLGTHEKAAVEGEKRFCLAAGPK